jgi:hypothetical protein
MRLLLYGLQRSGTNYLESLMLKYYAVRFLNDRDDRSAPLHKHFRLYDQKGLIPEPRYRNAVYVENVASLEGTLGVAPDFYLVISKDPYSWLLSYRAWARRCAWPPVPHHYILEYNLFYGKWLELGRETSQIVFVRYIDLLRDRMSELSRLESCMGIRKKILRRLMPPMTIEIRSAKDFTRKRRAYYLNEAYFEGYEPEDLRAVNRLLDQDVVAGLGYEMRDGGGWGDARS